MLINIEKYVILNSIYKKTTKAIPSFNIPSFQYSFDEEAR